MSPSNDENSKTDDLRPALSEADWKAFLPNAPVGRVAMIAVTDLGHISSPHVAAALCLYGQPFGFTQEDVTLLREQATVLRGAEVAPQGRSADREDAALLATAFLRALSRDYESLASRIAALLPSDPSETGP